MLSLARQRNYALQRGVPAGIIFPTPAQYRRMRHKHWSRKTHEHQPAVEITDDGPDGRFITVTRASCPRCRTPAGERRAGQ